MYRSRYNNLQDKDVSCEYNVINVEGNGIFGLKGERTKSALLNSEGNMGVPMFPHILDAPAAMNLYMRLAQRALRK